VTISDPIDQMTSRTLAQYALAVKAPNRRGGRDG
jgi:hypothetical protein